MSYQTKRKIMNGAVYLALALVIVAILCVSIITFTSANKPVEPVKTPTPQTETTTQSPKHTSEPKTQTQDTVATATPAPTHVTPTPSPTVPSPVPTKTKLPADNEETQTFSLPTEGHVMKNFCVEVPVFSFTMNDYRTHSGIDISAPAGSAVCSIAKGTVIKIHDDPLFGKTVSVDHGGGLVSVYSNLADELANGITEGVSVGEGQIIGAVGNSALIECAESDHLHFEITLGGTHKDPEVFLDYSSEDNQEDIPGNE